MVGILEYRSRYRKYVIQNTLKWLGKTFIKHGGGGFFKETTECLEKGGVFLDFRIKIGGLWENWSFYEK